MLWGSRQRTLAEKARRRADLGAELGNRCDQCLAGREVRRQTGTYTLFGRSIFLGVLLRTWYRFAMVARSSGKEYSQNVGPVCGTRTVSS